MEQTNVKTRPVKGKIVVILIAALAIILRGAAFVGSIIVMISTRFIYGLSPFTIQDLISLSDEMLLLSIDVLPFILLIACALFCNRKPKAAILAPITFGALALGQLINVAYYLLNEFLQDLLIGNYNTLYHLFGYNKVFSLLVELFVGVILAFPYVLIAAAFIFAVIGALKGLSNKVMVVIPCIVGIVGCISAWGSKFIYNLVMDLILLIEYGSYMIRFNYISIILGYLEIAVICLAFILFFVAVMIFALKNNLSEVIPVSEEKLNKLIETKPKKAFDIVTIRFEDGKITREEYDEYLERIKLGTV